MVGQGSGKWMAGSQYNWPKWRPDECLFSAMGERKRSKMPLFGEQWHFSTCFLNEVIRIRSVHGCGHYGNGPKRLPLWFGDSSHS